MPNRTHLGQRSLTLRPSFPFGEVGRGPQCGSALSTGTRVLCRQVRSRKVDYLNITQFCTRRRKPFRLYDDKVRDCRCFRTNGGTGSRIRTIARWSISTTRRKEGDDHRRLQHVDRRGSAHLRKIMIFFGTRRGSLKPVGSTNLLIIPDGRTPKM